MLIIMEAKKFMGLVEMSEWEKKEISGGCINPSFLPDPPTDPVDWLEWEINQIMTPPLTF